MLLWRKSRVRIGGYYAEFETNVFRAAFRSVSINTDDVLRLMSLDGVSQQKALEIIALREEKPFQDFADLHARVKGIRHNQDHIVIEF